MFPKRHIWDVWARVLHKWGLSGFAGWLIETTAPLHVLGAQLVYVGQPVLGLFWSAEQTGSLAEVLERPEETEAFIRLLREEPAG
ncbi:MAG TPA: hypothetical protein VMN57_10980 [Anaerolineales bacterium]|nr:hypothetical protein [Anaerolineales bacterium]